MMRVYLEEKLGFLSPREDGLPTFTLTGGIDGENSNLELSLDVDIAKRIPILPNWGSAILQCETAYFTCNQANRFHFFSRANR
eukprot:m.20385 g.20385  ORF g.20385 m.20385 type:complete len:83 (+) comp10538_c0_seq1:57-305(+)